MSDNARVSELLKRWQEQRLSGEQPTLDDICRDCPELIPALERQLSTTTESNQPAVPDRDPTHRADLSGTSTRVDPAMPTTSWIPGYESLGELGRGGMGVVYRARDLALKRVVAIKMVLGGQATTEGLARFQTEGEAVARLEHPHIVRILTSGVYQDQPYFVMEYVEGQSLGRAVQGQPQPPADAARLVQLLARAVHYAHQRGIVHRDLKPANVLLAAPSDEPALNAHLGCPKITDFGLAKRLDDVTTLTATGAVLGTPAYMAPEQAMGTSEDIGPGTDVWALGVILYELLTGRPPFKGGTAMQTLHQVCTLPAEPPGRLRQGLPRDLESICLKCLQKEPHRRYPSSAALAEDLARFLEGKSVQPPPAQTPPPAPSPPTQPPPGRSRWRLRVALALLLIGALAWVCWPFDSTDPPRQDKQDFSIKVYHGLISWHNVYATNRTGTDLANVKAELVVTFNNGKQEKEAYTRGYWPAGEEQLITWYAVKRGRVQKAQFTGTGEANGTEKRFKVLVTISR